MKHASLRSSTLFGNKYQQQNSSAAAADGACRGSDYKHRLSNIISRSLEGGRQGGGMGIRMPNNIVKHTIVSKNTLYIDCVSLINALNHNSHVI